MYRGQLFVLPVRHHACIKFPAAYLGIARRSKVSFLLTSFKWSRMGCTRPSVEIVPKEEINDTRKKGLQNAQQEETPNRQSPQLA